MAELNLTEQSFEHDVLKASLPAMIDFWAPWCGPCRTMGPVIEELASEFEGRVLIGKVNVDEHGALAQQYNVMSIPTIIFFKGGEVVDTTVGAVEKAVLVEKLQKLL